ncbi:MULTISPECIES: bifunctional ADP-dependent NAD(P)H-hydrate dehydratase/NAD(P)H-hydrate epimerase [Streptomyces]|uniref:Bifunctional NAD(P)H-hydrate repair enzyme n=1 Tax=Streptomyces qinglanensis TaxID=943816 RepID=A0A1E7K9X7_9ACTN|nr:MULTISPECIES: bifunctional ADP-dependent NAD(P)H-hydrate dehydratase/NAD(P)H-hydrate epimerase [Streptomyces]OEV00739.1 carbohydrate kinase [Streptomyces qinglanensis]
MRTGYGVQTVRAAEASLMARLPEGALMQRAAAGLAAACSGLLGRTYGARVVLLVGSGDNGGDALYAGARLARRGAGVTAVLLAPERVHEGGLAALRAAGGRALPAPGAVLEGVAAPVAPVLARADLVLDGIVGIGGTGGLRPAAVELADLVREAGVPVVAVDLPSGVAADTGEVPGPVLPAGATVTFGAYKPGLLVDPARELAGAVRLIDIGLEPHLPAVPDVEALQHADVARLLPRPQAESDKYRRGVVGVVAGSGRYPGAAVLAVSGALRSGAGAVRYVGPGTEAVVSRYPETLVSEGPPGHAGRVQAWAVGPGLGDEPAARQAVDEVLAGDVPVLVDADGLRLMDPDAVRARTAPTLLTPHAGEAAALLGTAREEVEAGRLAAVRELARRTGATVLLKGSTTLVAEPPGTDDAPMSPVRVNATGTGWLATAGSGDVLTGLAGGLLAAGLPALDAASAAAYLHGLAGRLATDPPAATDLAEALAPAWQDVLRGT